MRYRALLILVLVGLLIPGVLGASEIQTIEVIDTEDDGFITPSNNIIDTSALIHTSDPVMDIWAFWVFDDVDIESYEKLNNATLRLRGASTLDFDADNGFTLRAFTLDNLQNSWRPLPGMIKILPRTSSYRNVNTSNWYGPTWFEIDVTNIVREVINRYEWDGDAVGSGDSIGFIAIAVADETRYFYDYSGGPTYSAELVIGFGEDPPPPPAPPPAYNESTFTFVNETVTVVVNETSGDTETIDIFYSLDPGAWLNFSTFTAYGAQSGKITGLNDTWFQVTNMYGDSDCYLRRDYEDHRDNTSEAVSVKFGIKWEALPWTGPDAYTFVNMWGVSDEIDESQRWTTGYSFEERTWTDKSMGTGWAHDAGALKDSFTWSPQYMEVGLPYTLYYDLRLDMDTGFMNASLYNDIDMTDLNVTYNTVIVPRPGWPWVPEYEYLIAPSLPATTNTGFTGEFISRDDAGIEGWWLVWGNGTIIGVFDTYDDAIDALDGIVDPDPADPDPPGADYPTTGPFTLFKTRLYILIIGLGLWLGPIMFLAYQYDRGLSAGQFAGALIVMLIGLGLTLAIRQI